MCRNFINNPKSIDFAAKFVSVVFHPLVLGTLTITCQAFYFLDGNHAWIPVLMIIGLITVPIVIRNYVKVRRGEYSGFDVPDRKQRFSFYIFLIGTFTVTETALYLMHQPKVLVLTIGIGMLMAVLCFSVNFIIKPSLHLAMIFYSALAIIKFSLMIGVALLISSLLVAAARKFLHQHTVLEIISGSLIGAGCGLLLINHL